MSKRKNITKRQPNSLRNFKPYFFGFLLVVGAAVFLLQATGSAATTRVKSGYLMIYSQQGRYNMVKIHAPGSGSDEVLELSTRRCGGAFPTDTRSIIKRLPSRPVLGTVPAKKLKCTPIAAGQYYWVYYGKNNKFSDSYVRVNVNPNKCNIVKPSMLGGTSEAEAAEYNGACPAHDTSDTPTLLTPNIEVTGAKSKSNKYITGTVALKVPSEEFTKVQCGGTVTVSFNGGNSTAPLKFKYIKNTTSGQNEINNGNDYCRAKYKSGTLPSGTYTVTANFSGSAYLNSGQASTSVEIPSRIPQER